jgi:AP-5 complex subunit mu-1
MYVFGFLLKSFGLGCCSNLSSGLQVSFKIVGASVSRMSIDTKSVNIYPTTKSPVEFSAQVTSGDYILWNTLGKAPSAAVV